MTIIETLKKRNMGMVENIKKLFMGTPAILDHANEQIENLIATINDADCEKLIDSIRTVKKYFTKETLNIQIRPYREQDITYVIDRQLSLYESERQFTTEIWKNYLTQGVLSLVDKFDPAKDCMLILECNGSPSGCIAITHTENNIAQLRYFFLEHEGIPLPSSNENTQEKCSQN